MLRRKGNFKFQGRVHSKRGVLSLLLGLLVIMSFLTISFISGTNQGNGPFVLGVVGLITFALAVIGFLLGIKSFREKDIFYVAPVIGVGSNGIMTVLLFCLYIVGLVS